MAVYQQPLFVTEPPAITTGEPRRLTGPPSTAGGQLQPLTTRGKPTARTAVSVFATQAAHAADPGHDIYNGLLVEAGQSHAKYALHALHLETEKVTTATLRQQENERGQKERKAHESQVERIQKENAAESSRIQELLTKEIAANRAQSTMVLRAMLLHQLAIYQQN